LAARILVLVRRFGVTWTAVVVIRRVCENGEDHNEWPLGAIVPSGRDRLGGTNSARAVPGDAFRRCCRSGGSYDDTRGHYYVRD
jgi:hypothetical protein